MAKQKLGLVAALAFVFLGSVFSEDAFADAHSDCKNAASSKYGVRYTVHQKTFDSRCDAQGGSGNYGTAVPEYTEYPEWTRLSGVNLSFDIRRVTYSVGEGGYNTGADLSGCIENNVSNATISGDPMELMTLKPKTKRTWIGTGTYHIGMSASAVKGGWSNWGDGGTATVSFNPSAIDSSASVNSSGLVESSFNITTHLYCYDSKENNNTIYYKFYKITNIEHGTPKASYNGTDYTTGTSSSSPITLKDGSLSFTHQLRRNDGWSNPSSADITNVYTTTITKNGTAIKSTGWTSKTFGAAGVFSDVPDSISIADIKLDSNAATEICSIVTHRNVKGLHGHTANDDSASNTSDSKICVWVKLDNLTMSSWSQAYNSVTSPAAKGWSNGASNLSNADSSGSSRKNNYTVYFYHGLSVAGDSARAADYSFDIYRGSSASGPWTKTASDVKRLSGGGGGQVYTSTENFNFTSFGQTITVCEKIVAKPQKIIYSGSGSGEASGTSESIACNTIRRRTPDTITLSADSHVVFNGTTDPDKIKYLTTARRHLDFYHNITDPNATYNFSTDYIVEYTEDNWATVINRSKSICDNADHCTATTNAKPTDPINIDLEPGEQRTVCERIKLKPTQFYIHKKSDGTDDGIEVIPGQTEYKTFAQRCITIARPAPVEFEDPDITVSAESQNGTVADSQGEWNASLGAYLVKTETVDLTFNHRFSRTDVRHTDYAKTATGNVSVNYRFDDPGVNFSASSLESTYITPPATVANNSTTSWFASNITDSLKNAVNGGTTRVSNIRVSDTPITKCQSVHYLSNVYKSYGTYWSVEGKRLRDLDPDLGAGDALLGSRIVRTSSVNKSDAGCVNLLRPYNFKIKSISVDSSPDKATNQTNSFSVSFKVNIGRNRDDFLLTDVPNANVRIIGFVVNNTPTNLAGIINYSGDPCSYFGGKATTTDCTTLKEETANLHDASADNSGTNYYNSTVSARGYTATYPYTATMPNLPAGSKYCVAIAVQPTDSGTGLKAGFNQNWSISAASCANVGKQPSLQVWGGNTVTNGGIKTATSTIKVGDVSRAYGSWDDYAVIANGKVAKMASGAAIAGGTTAVSTLLCSTSPLTISNSKCATTPTAGSLGESGIVTAADVTSKLRSRYLTNPANYFTASVIDTTTFSSHGVGTYDTVTSLNPVVIYSAGNIQINSDILYARHDFTTYVLPQVIVFAEGNISIADSVKQIDAWLIAGGHINTCTTATGGDIPLSISTCGEQLHLNAPISAASIDFRRTHGGDGYIDASGQTSITTPAEIINYSPAVYLFGLNESFGNGQPITAYIHELPPRY